MNQVDRGRLASAGRQTEGTGLHPWLDVPATSQTTRGRPWALPPSLVPLGQPERDIGR